MPSPLEFACVVAVFCLVDEADNHFIPIHSEPVAQVVYDVLAKLTVNLCERGADFRRYGLIAVGVLHKAFYVVISPFVAVYVSLLVFIKCLAVFAVAVFIRMLKVHCFFSSAFRFL